MASITTTALALEFLTKLESDLQAHNTGGQASIYKFAGYDNGTAVGITRTAQVNLNRGGQMFQFLAGYFTSTSDSTIKGRIAKATAQIYNIFASRPVFSNGTAYEDMTKYETTGQFKIDPSAPSMLLGLMMIDKQGVTAHSQFTGTAVHNASYIRSTMIPRIVMKINKVFLNEPSYLNILVKGDNYTWANQKMALLSINNAAMGLGTISLFGKLYSEDYYEDRSDESYKFHRLIATKYGSTFQGLSETPINVTTSGASAGTNLSVAIGGNEQGRGAFPSIGYNAFVALGMILQAFAERATSSSTFSDLKSSVSGHPLYIDALKIQNYYRDRVAEDGFLYELGAHRNAGGDAIRFRGDWKKALLSQGLTESEANSTLKGGSQFDVLSEKSNYPGQAGYAYGLMWVNPTHTLFSNIATEYRYGVTGKTHDDVDYSKVGSSASVTQALASTGEASAIRIASGLGIALIQGVSEVK